MLILGRVLQKDGGNSLIEKQAYKDLKLSAAGGRDPNGLFHKFWKVEVCKCCENDKKWEPKDPNDFWKCVKAIHPKEKVVWYCGKAEQCMAHSVHKHQYEEKIYTVSKDPNMRHVTMQDTYEFMTQEKMRIEEFGKTRNFAAPIASFKGNLFKSMCQRLSKLYLDKD